MRLLYLSVLVIFAFLTNRISADRYVSMENSRYRPYENLFNKKPKLNFRKTYYNRYISNAVSQIDKKHPKVNVCFKNMITIKDPLLSGYDPIYKDSRIIAEYEFSKISKYTSLKFYLTTKNCHMNLDFDHTLSNNILGWTTFYVSNGIPQANVQIDRVQLKNYAISARISYLRAYMQILMHEILHGLGLGHSVDDVNSKSMIRAVYDGSTQQLLYKKDVYNLRSIYGARRRQTALSNGTIDEFDYPEPSEWDDLVLRNMEDNSSEIIEDEEVSSTTQEPSKTTTERLIESKAERPSNSIATNKATKRESTRIISEADLQKEFSRVKYLLSHKTTTERSNKPTSRSQKPDKSTTIRPDGTTTEKSTIISEADLQREFSKAKYLLSHKTTTERSNKPTSLSRKPDKSTTNRPDGTTTEKSTVISEADLQKIFSKVKYLITHKTTTERSDESTTNRRK